MNLWKYPCPEGSCPEPVHRPYSKARGKNYLPSVTQLAGISADEGEGIEFAAAKIAAEYCLNYGMNRLDEQTIEEVVLIASRVPAARWGTDAVIGTYTHKAIESFAFGSAWTGPEDLYEWDEDRLYLFVDIVKGWWEKRQPSVYASEFIVANHNIGYIGTGDLLSIFGLFGEPTLIDLKTHREPKDDRTLYFEKWAKQLILLANGTHLRHYHGHKLIDEIEWTDEVLPRPTLGLILSVDPKGWREFKIDLQPTPDYEALMRSLVYIRNWKAPMSQAVR